MYIQTLPVEDGRLLYLIVANTFTLNLSALETMLLECCVDMVMALFTSCIYYLTINVDCNDGDLHLVGSQWSYEGTIEVCFGTIWGLISDSDWSQQDAEVACRQLGYQIQGNILLLHKISYVHMM